jgi:Zn ribbon nucleic-acid-binding protein
MSYLEGFGDQVTVSIQPDKDGYIGRECPKCESYFKITLGTGLKGDDLPCHCPYCGHAGDQGDFGTREQIEYAQSIAVRQIMKGFNKTLKAMEFDATPGAFLGISLKVTPAVLPPIQHYREKRLETEVICETCTLKYMIYGVFAFCPDCRTHNSLQILDKNLDLTEKQVALAAQVEADLSDRLIASALENAVSSFDGFGREACRVHAVQATEPASAKKMSFQNPSGARTNVQQLFNQDFACNVIVGFLFGLGFDTATQVGLLGISAAAATARLPIWSILILPLLFTAGMCLVDTIDGILMLGAYGWAYVRPIRKLYYNMTITAISVLMALLVGGIEILNIVGDRLDLHGRLWDRIGELGDHFGLMGVCIVSLFIFSWLCSAVAYRWLGYDQLE